MRILFLIELIRFSNELKGMIFNEIFIGKDWKIYYSPIFSNNQELEDAKEIRLFN